MTNTWGTCYNNHHQKEEYEIDCKDNFKYVAVIECCHIDIPHLVLALEVERRYIFYGQGMGITSHLPVAVIHSFCKSNAK